MGTKLVVYNEASQPPQMSGLSDGIQGNYEIVLRMIRMVRESMIFDKSFEVGIKKMLLEAGLSSNSEPEEIFKWVYYFVKKNVIYVKDPAGKAEFLTSAKVTLSNGFGDCDDQSVLVASMLGVLGFNDVKFCLVRWNALDETFSHVYTVVYYRGKRYALDTCLPEDDGFNREREYALAKEFPIFTSNPKMDSPMGVLGQIVSHTKDVAKRSIIAAPSFMYFLPLGIGYPTSKIFYESVTMLSGLSEESVKNSYIEKAAISAKQMNSVLAQLAAGKISIDQANMAAKRWLAEVSNVPRGDVSQEDADKAYASVKQKYDLIMSYTGRPFGIAAVPLSMRNMLLTGLAVIGAVAIYMYSSTEEE